jgi:hypothetical protein
MEWILGSVMSLGFGVDTNFVFVVASSGSAFHFCIRSFFLTLFSRCTSNPGGDFDLYGFLFPLCCSVAFSFERRRLGLEVVPNMYSVYFGGLESVERMI